MEQACSATLDYNPDVNYDEPTLQQKAEIEKQICATQPLIGPEEDFALLHQEYCNEKSDPMFLKKIDDLKTCFRAMRRVRSDGSCFFRAFGFAYLESLFGNINELQRFKKTIAARKDELISVGMPQFTLEDFYDTFVEVVDRIPTENYKPQDLLETFNDQGYSDYLVVFLRLLVSGYLQKNQDFFLAFLDGFLTVKEFCEQEVEPMGKESDHIHIIALASSLDVGICVEYLDRTNTDGPVQHNFPEDRPPSIFLLYRPGHYDILYRS